MESIRYHPADADPLNLAISIFIPHRPRPGLLPQGTQTTSRGFTHPSTLLFRNSSAPSVTNDCVSPINELSAPTFPTNLAPQLAQYDSMEAVPTLPAATTDAG